MKPHIARINFNILVVLVVNFCVAFWLFSCLFLFELFIWLFCSDVKYSANNTIFYYFDVARLNQFTSFAVLEVCCSQLCLPNFISWIWQKASSTSPLVLSWIIYTESTNIVISYILYNTPRNAYNKNRAVAIRGVRCGVWLLPHPLKTS
jgi:hypothetical protein